MARGSRDTMTRPGRSFKGRFYVTEKEDKQVFSAWPKPRGAARTGYQAYAQKRFADACFAMKRHAADFQAVFREEVKDTPFLPRDPLLAALMGRGPQIALPGGKLICSMATRVNMSEVLDNIAWEPGTMLFRGENLWMGIPPGENGQVLYYQSPAQAPAWGPASGGGASLTTVLQITTVTATATVSPRVETFDSPVIDDFGIWNPAQPTRLYVPEGAERIKIGFQVRGPQAASANDVLVSLRSNGTAEDYVGNPRVNMRMDAAQISAGHARIFFNGQSSWLDATGHDYFEMVTYWQNTGIFACQPGTTIWIEAQF